MGGHNKLVGGFDSRLEYNDIMEESWLHAVHGSDYFPITSHSDVFYSCFGKNKKLNKDHFYLFLLYLHLHVGCIIRFVQRIRNNSTTDPHLIKFHRVASFSGVCREAFMFIIIVIVIILSS